MNEKRQKQKTYVYAGSKLLAIQQLDSQGQPEVVFSHTNLNNPEASPQERKKTDAAKQAKKR